MATITSQAPAANLVTITIAATTPVAVGADAVDKGAVPPTRVADPPPVANHSGL